MYKHVHFGFPAWNFRLVAVIWNLAIVFFCIYVTAYSNGYLSTTHNVKGMELKWYFEWFCCVLKRKYIDFEHSQKLKI